MSYDLETWSVHTEQLPKVLPSPDRWMKKDGTWVLPGRGWQIVVDEPVGVDPEEVSEEIGALLPGIAYLTRVSLEPGHAPSNAHQLLQRCARNLAKAAYGVTYDPQEGSLKLGTGVKRYTSPGRENYSEDLIFSWWFGTGALETRADYEELLRLLGKYMPEALPKKYGTFEPPEFRLAEMGEAHLLDFLVSESRAGMTILCPRRPVTDFSITLPEEVGTKPGPYLGYRANTLSIVLQDAVLKQPGWERQIELFWRRISEFLRPFYGDVRVLPDGNFHPVRSWFWRGFPKTSGLAAVVGQPYLDLWPPFAAVRKDGDSLAYFGGPARDIRTDIFAGAGGVPTDLINPNSHAMGIELYPRLWPFELPD